MSNNDPIPGFPPIPGIPSRRLSQEEPSIELGLPAENNDRLDAPTGESLDYDRVSQAGLSEEPTPFGRVYDDFAEVPLPVKPVAKSPVVGVADYDSDYAQISGVGANLPPNARKNAQALIDLIADDECSEVLMNGPKEIAKKVAGARYQTPIVFDSVEIYHRVINEVVLGYCKENTDLIDGKTTIIEGQLELPSITPNRASMLARVHIIAPPGVDYAKVTIAKKPRVDLSLDDLAANGSMSQSMADFLKAAALARQTIVISGSSGSGKTTMLQALTHHFDHNDRVIVIEETPELRLTLGDVVYLHATPDRPGQDPDKVYSLEVWTKQANRMRADRIIVGEVRGAEMAEFLNVANSGIEGSATTVHANNPRACLEKILSLATKSLTSTSEPQLRKEIASTIDIIVQVSLVDGRHLVTAIEEISDTVALQGGNILTNPLFEYDKILGRHQAVGTISEDMRESFAGNGVPVQIAWFKKN